MGQIVPKTAPGLCPVCARKATPFEKMVRSTSTVPVTLTASINSSTKREVSSLLDPPTQNASALKLCPGLCPWKIDGTLSSQMMGSAERMDAEELMVR